MKKLGRAMVLTAGLVFAARADVKSASEKMSVDGRLDEPCWAAADWTGDFQELAGRKQGGEIIQTSFAIVANSRAIYVGVRCKEPAMEALRALPPNNIWNCDCVEIFLAPSGRSFSFYHFAVPYDPRNGTVTRFLSEAGNIQPDPYAPAWKVARSDGTDGWTAELEIPFSSFYMTRNDEWSTTWLVNVARTRRAGPNYQWTTWSPLKNAFLESDRYLSVKGFPKRVTADDVALTDVTSEITARKEGRLEGRLKMKAFVLKPGDYTLSCSSGTTAKVSLKRGLNDVSVPCAYPANNRYQTGLSLTRDATGERYERTFPVLVDFEEIRVKLTTPQYRDNFYPGQDSSMIVGTVKTAGEGAVKLTLEGPSIPRVEKTPDANGAFSFETPGFEAGTATLTVDFGGVTKRVPIRKLAKTGHQMTWVEDGCLVVDGKRTFRRDIYAWHYRGGTAFDARTAADRQHLGITMLKLGGTLEPGRVIKGLEEREAKKDGVPCKEYFDKIDKLIEWSKTRDFCHWYISDEPECRGVSPIYLKHIYEYVKERDPYHVILTSSRAGLAYIDCADWFETHPYIGPVNEADGTRHFSQPMSEVGGFIDAFEPEKHPDKCVGFLPQMFAYRYSSLENDYPTFDEYRCHTWAAFLRGAKSLNPYAYHDMGDRAALYEGNCFVNASVIALEDLLLGGKRTTLMKTEKGECARWDLPDGEAMFALVNFTQEPQAFEVKGLNGDFRPFRSKKAFNLRCQPQPSTSTFNLQPFEVVLGTTKKRDAGLTTVEETAALIARCEYERTHRDNQLLEQYGKIPGIGYKLIDGVRDMWAFSRRWCVTHDFDIAFPDRPIRFSKVRLFGANVKGIRVSVRRNGEWVPVNAACTSPEPYCFEVEAGEVLRTVKLRITVETVDKNKTLEVYELEVPNVAGEDDAQTARTAKPEPPAEALWSFDAQSAVCAAKPSRNAWCSSGQTNVLPRADGGFTVTATSIHGVTFDPEYPWLELEVDKFVRNEKPGVKCYHAWTIHGIKMAGLCGGVSYPQTGLYTIRMRTDKRVNDYIRIYDYNYDIGFRRFRNVKRPPNCLSATSDDAVVAPGSEIEIRLDLAEPCEEVITEFRMDDGRGGGAVAYKINDKSQVELKATDETRCHWAARVPVKSCKDAKSRRVFVKCTLLGGALDVPILTNFSQPFKAK